MTRIIESPYPQIIQLSENMTGSGFVAYSITRLSDKIIVTQYCTAGIVKSIFTYTLENNKIATITRETH